MLTMMPASCLDEALLEGCVEYLVCAAQRFVMVLARFPINKLCNSLLLN